MKIVAEGIAVFEDVFLRNEEVIELAEVSENWRQGTAGKGIDPNVRITDIHDLDTKTELHQELLDALIASIQEYANEFPSCRVSKGEHLRVGRYPIGGHYGLHADAGGSERVLSAVVYLNDDFDGGAIDFPRQKLTLKPKPGSIILFPSNFIYEHQSLPVTDGKKYIVLSWFA